MGRYDSDLPASIAVQVDQLADRFETAWRSGARPQIEEFLADAEGPRRELLAELLILEWELRQAAGEVPRLEEYQRRFPEDQHFVADVLAAARSSAVSGDTPRGSQATLTEGAPRELPGEFGDYTLLEVLGRGGMGVVYKARQRSLDRLVAVKLLRSGTAADEAERERFRREAEAAARLDHPQIISIYEVGQHADERFFSMEYVAGRSLAALVAEHPLEPQRAAQYLRDVAAAIHYSHQQGILHRDLKPSNVLVDRFDRPRVMDFGLARRIETDARLTATGALLGTPSYMPPEQAGDGALGPPADVYAMGAMLYELLTGHPPFQAATALDTLMMVMDRAPVPPRQLNAKVPRDLETICLKCLEKSPARRYPTAEALAGDLDRFLRGVPIAARPVTRLQRFGRWCRRNPALAGLGGLAAAALLVVVGLLVALAVSQSLAARRLAEEHGATQTALAEVTARGRELEEEARRTKAARGKAAMTALSHSTRLCEQGDHSAGLLWLATGLQLISKDDVDGQWSVRTRIDLWQHALDPIGAYRHWETKIRRHSRPILGPHGKTILTGGNIASSDRGAARLWDVSSGQPLTPLLHHGGSLDAMALSPDGRWILTAGGATAKLWDAESEAPPRTLLPQISVIRLATFGPDGSWIALVSPTADVRCFETETGNLLNSFTITIGDSPRVSLDCICPDRRTFLVHTDSGSLQRCDLKTGAAVSPVLSFEGRFRGLAVGPDSRKLLITGMVGRNELAWLSDATVDPPLVTPLETEGRIYYATFSPDGKQLLTYHGNTNNKGDLRLWNAQSAEPIGGLLKGVEGLLAVGFLPQHIWLLTYHGGVLWNVETGETAAAPVPTETQLLFPSHVGNWQKANGAPCSKEAATALLRFLGRPLTHNETVFGACFNADGTRLATESNQAFRQWDPVTGEQVAPPVPRLANRLWGYREDGRTIVTSGEFVERLGEATRDVVGLQVRPVAFTRDYSHIAGSVTVADPTCPLLLIETESGRVTELSLRSEKPSALRGAFDPAGRQLVAVQLGRPGLWMWDITGREVWTIPAMRATDAVFSPDGSRLAVIVGENVQLLDAADGTPAFAYPLTHINPVMQMAFSPDGKLLATGCASELQLWDAATGERLGTVRNDFYLLRRFPQIDFSPDGNTLLLACGDRAIRLLPVPSPTAGAPEDVLRATEVLTGMKLGDDGQLRVLSANAWRDQRRLLEQQRAIPER